MLSKATRSLSKILDSGSELKSRILQGGAWLGAGSGVEQSLRLARNMILARILIPDLLGSVAIIIAVNALFQSFTEVGIREAVIQNKRSDSTSYLNAAWWLAFLRSALIFVIGYIASPYIVEFYDIQHLLPHLRVSFLASLFYGTMSTRSYLALKHMDYRRWVLVSQGGAVCGILTTIVLGIVYRNIWALVIGFIMEFAGQNILSYILCPFKPGIYFEKETLNELIKYARGMFGLPILYFIFMQADIFVVGKILPKAELGLYSMVVSLARVPALLIAVFVNPILLPAISKFQDDHQRINNLVIRSTLIISLFGFPFIFLVFLYGKDILRLVYGDIYAVAAIPFAILFTTTLLRTCSSPIAAVYLSIGRPELHRLFSGVRSLIIILIIYPLVVRIGLIGASLAVFFSLIVAYMFQVLQLRSLTGLKPIEYLVIFKRSLITSLPVLITWGLFKNTFSNQPHIHLLTGIITCLATYLISAIYLLRKQYPDQSAADISPTVIISSNSSNIP